MYIMLAFAIVLHSEDDSLNSGINFGRFRGTLTFLSSTVNNSHYELYMYLSSNLFLYLYTFRGVVVLGSLLEFAYLEQQH